MKERDFQKKLIRIIKNKYPSAIILKNDPNYIQGIPDILILYKDRWVALECKIKKEAHRQPNQIWYISKMKSMSYASFVYPENLDKVLNDIFELFGKEDEDLMKIDNITEIDKRDKFKRGTHSLFSPSNYHWINYSEDKMIEMYINMNAKKIGTELHETAALLIKNKIKLPETNNTLNLYVNDCILTDMYPEIQVFYSDFFCGTIDALGLMNGVLRIYDLKTGRTKASINQLYIYLALFCLEHHTVPNDFKDIILRVYQYNDFIEEHPTNDIICPIMDKIKTVNKVLLRMEENGNV